MLEDLHAQIVRATKEGLPEQAEAKRWVQDIQRMLAILHIEFFTNPASRRCSRTSRSVHAWPSNEASSTFDGSRHRRLTVLN